MAFHLFKTAITKQFATMQKHQLFVTDTNKDDIWNLYLDSFPPGTNNIFRERREYDCQCCKSFIRQAANIVSINPDGDLTSIWDIKISGYYQEVADALSMYVKSKPICNFLMKTDIKIGTDFNHSLFEDKIESWEHFYLEMPDKVIHSNNNIGTELSNAVAAHDVFTRGLETISQESINIVLDLISQNTLYRGEEHKHTINNFFILLKESQKIPSKSLDNYIWANCLKPGSRIRNTVIGTLLTDISEDVDLEIAVNKYGHKVDPGNYKQPKSLATPKMIKAAQATFIDLGLSGAEHRRHATVDDLTINNVLFADKSVLQTMDVFDQLVDDLPENLKSIIPAEEITINDFITNVLPTCKKIEMLFEPRHAKNLLSLIAPVNTDIPPITKWSNNFSWSYNGELTDSSMEQKVKSMGGDTSGPLRFSINWAEDDWAYDNSDLDAWAQEPYGSKIGFSSNFTKLKAHRSPCSGQLDVDIMNPSSYNHKNIVENIVWTDKTKMQSGTYKLWVHQYYARNSKGFKAEIKMDDQIYTYHYNNPVVGNIPVAEIMLKDGNFTIKHILPAQNELTSTHWNINTHKFHNVKMLMHSPNHWDGEKTGNRHYFFIIESCLNPNSVRGFYNEFLPIELTPHRKAFQMLGSKMRAEFSDNQVSGLGFSTTKHNHITCRVSGSFSRTLRIIF